LSGFAESKPICPVLKFSTALEQTKQMILNIEYYINKITSAAIY